MPGFFRVPVTSPSALERGGAMARIGDLGRAAGRLPSKMMRSQDEPSLRPALAGYSSGPRPNSRVFGRYESAVSR